MAPETASKKRRAAPAKEIEEDSEDDILDANLEGVLSDDESELGSDDGEDLEDEDDSDEGSNAGESNGIDEEDGEDDEDDDDVLHSDGAGSDVDADEVLDKLLKEQDPPAAAQNGDKEGSSTNEVDDADEPNYTVETDANGGVRYVYKEIDPVYDSDDSDAKEPINTIGNIPLSFYDSYPHIGYDISGKKIMRPAAGEALDALLDSIEIPRGFTGLTDPATGKPLQLSQDELELLRKIQQNEIPEDGYDPYPDTVEYFTSIVEEMPLSAAPEPKRRFLPSKMEAQRIWKMVKAIREGRILPYKPPEEREREEAEKDDILYDIWANEVPQEAHVMHIAAPKEPPPGYDMSYNPPAEYLPSKAERDAWEKQDPEEREKEYLPEKYSALRKVPGYGMLVKERFERCLDLYLAPRVKKNRLNIDPASLLPKLPRAEDLRPFPTVCQTVYRGHQGWVRSVSIDPSGNFVASGGSDGTVRIWDLLTGRQLWKARISSDEVVQAVRWRPTKDAFVLAAAAGEDVFFMVPPVIDPEFEQASRDVLDAGFGYQANGAQQTADGKPVSAKWTRPGSNLENEGVLLKVTVRSMIKTISWHRGGRYMCSISPAGGRSAVAIHTLAQHRTQMPFRRSNMSQSAQFHPERPHLFLASKQSIKVWDLQKMELVKKVEPGAKIISGFDLHPSGNHMIVGAYDRRLLWHDLDLSNRPYKVMRFHDKAVRAVSYHKGGHPLAADASDDGSLQVFHSKVVNDLMENATIIPLKKLTGHKVVESVGVLDIDFHPREPWLVSAGADGTIRLWM